MGVELWLDFEFGHYSTQFLRLESIGACTAEATIYWQPSEKTHSVSCCAITFDENYVFFFAFVKHEVSSDAVEGKTVRAKGAGHNPEHRRLCKTPVGAAHSTKKCQNLIPGQQHIIRLDNNGRKRYRQNSTQGVFTEL